MTSQTPAELASQLHRQLLALDEMTANVARTKESLLKAMLADPTLPRPYKTSWGQIQLVNKLVWKFRDGAVTETGKIVARLERELKAAKKVLKGAEDAAKVAGKATVESESWSLRVVRGDD